MDKTVALLSEVVCFWMKLLMTGLSVHFQKIFRMVGLTQYADLYPSVEDALASLNSGNNNS